MKTLWCLVALTAVVVASPAKPKALDWWQTSIFYQIYPMSYKDSNGDGKGDLNGIREKLDHLKDIGVGGVWLSPIFDSPMADFGYDISDFRNIYPVFGTMEDFDALIARAEELGIKLILDFVPNHSSDEHEWFQRSLNREDPYTNYYVWHDGKISETGERVPPNNWRDLFGGGAAWEWREERQQFYLHQFHRKQPDLNYNDPNLVEEMKDILRFWLDKGVYGFRVDAIPTLFEEDYLSVPDDEYSAKQHLDATYDMVQQWRVVMDEKSTEETKVLMLETYGTLDQVMRYYGTEDKPGGHFPFNFRFVSDLNGYSSATDFANSINAYLERTTDPLHWPNWVIGNHDNHRVATRYGPELVDAMNMLVMMLPGIGVTYNGEEIGMEDTYITWEQCQDPQGINAGPEHYLERTRDVERTPFQWDSTINSGFSVSASTWLPVNENYKTLNVEAEKAAEESHYHVYKSLAELRKTATVQTGSTQVEAITDKVLALTRSLEGAETYVVLINFGDVVQVDLTQKFPNLPGELVAHTSCIHCGIVPGAREPTNAIPLMRKVGIVFTTETV